MSTASYDGTTDDLLTGGLGYDGLQSATAPNVSATPTAAELRRLSIYTNYRALVDMTTEGGYGRLYGPNVPLDGSAPVTTPGAGKVPGTEYVAVSRDANGAVLATFMTQVPTNFDKNNPCIVTATSSGSRNVYGAVSAAGEWGLKRGCAVAYTDKGTAGAEEMDTGIVLTIDGLAKTLADAGNNALFVADVTGDTRPARYAFKHAHSERNVEKDWGLFTLQAIQFAFYAVNQSVGDVDANNQRLATFVPANTVVIASSVSNGGGASLRAAEQDTDGLIDAVVVGEPQLSVNVGFPTPSFSIRRGNGAALPANAYGKPLVHYVGVAGLFQPCAAYASTITTAPLRETLLPPAQAQARCASLAAAGLLGTPAPATFPAQADAALAAMRLGGWEPESDPLHGWQFGSDTTMAVAVTYNNAYARAKPREYLCDFSFGTTNATTGLVETAATSPMSTLFALGNGIPPTRGIGIVYNAVTPNPVNYRFTPDLAFEGAQCLRALWKTRSPNPTPGSLAARLQTGADEVLATGNLRGKPAIIVHGRADALVPVNHSSRTYFGANKAAEGANSQLSYIEVANAQHFDALLGVAGFNERFVPLHYYNIQALNAMWAHLKSNAPLPGSQVVRTLPRGTGAPALAPANLPAIATTPGPNDAITFTANTVVVPD